MSKTCAVFAHEFRTFWYSPIAYIVLIVFLVVMTWMFFTGFFIQGNASLGGLFGLIPVAFMIILPALSMRQWAEEKKSGTLELLMTKPVTEWEAVLGKYLATTGLLAVLLLLTVPLTISVARVSTNGLDTGVVVASYIGALLLGMTYLAIGGWVSSITENQIVAYILGVVLIFVFFIIGNITMLVSSSWVLPLEYMGLGKHFASMSRGVFDTRDLIYYASMIFLFLYLTTRTVESRKWS